MVYLLAFCHLPVLSANFTVRMLFKICVTDTRPVVSISFLVFRIALIFII